LAAALYGVLAITQGVRFDRATDLAGRHGVGLYMRSDGTGTELPGGWLKEEIVINPVTYAYLGYLDVATAAHTFTGSDETRHVSAGQVLGWAALLRAAIVNRPGQVP
jgi:hypothetical protein